jgi:hypothetical protein
MIYCSKYNCVLFLLSINWAFRFEYTAFREFGTFQLKLVLFCSAVGTKTFSHLATLALNVNVNKSKQACRRVSSMKT